MVSYVLDTINERFWQKRLLREANHHFNTPEQTRLLRQQQEQHRADDEKIDSSRACYESDGQTATLTGQREAPETLQTAGSA